MRFPFVRFTKVALIVAGGFAAACAQPNSGQGPRTDMSVLTYQTLVDDHFLTAYDAVASLRSNWMNAKGTDSFTSPTEVRVYLNNTLLGGIETLREIGTPTVVFIRHYDGIAATARWGLGHGAGVIFVSTRDSAGEPGDPAARKPPTH